MWSDSSDSFLRLLNLPHNHDQNRPLRDQQLMRQACRNQHNVSRADRRRVPTFQAASIGIPAGPVLAVHHRSAGNHGRAAGLDDQQIVGISVQFPRTVARHHRELKSDVTAARQFRSTVVRDLRPLNQLRQLRLNLLPLKYEDLVLDRRRSLWMCRSSRNLLRRARRRLCRLRSSGGRSRTPIVLPQHHRRNT